ncbi:uncharacterized protein LOC134449018 [Engraulis encrasicolus]|uniref:uncharacterized protein LOC134449018 n=1 Tax=Engraulis encrasicolus TaxID=184585 RepID=UPI002FD00967
MENEATRRQDPRSVPGMNLAARVWIIIVFTVLISQFPSSSGTDAWGVRYTTKGPLYVALGRDLVLTATILNVSNETSLTLSWERGNQAHGTMRLADRPGRLIHPRVTIEDKVLRLRGMEESDYGDYKFTATNKIGEMKHDTVAVRKAERPPAASIVLLCHVSETCQWDSPVVTWLVDGVKVTNQGARTSEGGAKLHLQEVKGRIYTCISDSCLGTSTAHFFFAGNVAVALTVERLLILATFGLSFYFCGF